MRGRQEGAERIVVIAFVVVDVATFALSLALGNGSGPVDVRVAAAAVNLALLAALIRRHRWAWWIWVVVSGLVVPGLVINENVLASSSDVISLALLLSLPMRRYVRKSN